MRSAATRRGRRGDTTAATPGHRRHGDHRGTEGTDRGHDRGHRPRARPPSAAGRRRASAWRAAAAAASRTARTRTTARTRPARSAWRGTRRRYSFNTNTNRGNATANTNPLVSDDRGTRRLQLLRRRPQLINNDQFGTCTIESLDPLTVTYTINEGVTWSDGTPVDAADMILSGPPRAASTTTPTRSSPTPASRPRPTRTARRSSSARRRRASPSADAAYAAAFDPETGRSSRATPTRSRPASRSTRASESLQLVTQFPEISEDGRSVTATWDSFYVDYQTAGLSRASRPRRRPEGPRHRGPDGGQGGADRGVPGQRRRGRRSSRSPRPGTPYFDATSLPDDPACTPATARTTWSTSPTTAR